MDKHLSYWQDELDIELFTKWHTDNEDHMQDIWNIRTRCIDEGYKSMVDIGAGTALIYDLLDNQIDYQGVEITPKFVEDAKSRNIPMILGDIEKLPFDDKSYDVCIASSVLNHLYDYRPALREMARVAKKEIIISFFKPSIEQLFYNPPGSWSSTIGYYGGNWDNVGNIFSCPQIGFYPNRVHHCSLVKLYKDYKMYESPFGFYTHYHEDESGKPTCIHHYFELNKLFNFLNELGSEINCMFNMEYGGRPDLFINTSNEDNSEKLHDAYAANIFYLKMTRY